MQFTCNLCSFGTNNLNRFQIHYVRYHRFDQSFSVACGIGACSYTCRNWNTFRSHIHRKHKDFTESSQQSENESEDSMEVDRHDVPFNDISDMRFQNSLFTMSLEVQHNVSQKGIDDIVTSTSILLDSQIHLFKEKLKNELSSRNIHVDSSLIDNIHIDHMLNEFSTSKKRFSFYEKCSDLPFVKPVEIVLGINDKTQKPALAYYIPFSQSLNKLLQMPEVWSHIQKPHYSSDEFMNDICDGDYVRSNPLFHAHPKALQVVLNTDDIEIVNPLGSHTKKHKITLFYYFLANIPPQYRSRLSCIQLLAIGKTRDVRGNDNVGRLLHDFLSTLNKLSGAGISMSLWDQEHTIRGALVIAPCDTIAANWLGKFKEGVAFAFKNCRMCEVSGSDIKNKYIDTQCSLRSCDKHAECCDFLAELSKKSFNYWSKMWGINGKSCLMNLENFSITSGLVQDPMHIFLEGIMPNELSCLLYHFIYTNKIFTLNWFNSKIEDFSYSYLHNKSKPEMTFAKAHIDNCTKIKQTSSAMLTLCQVFPLIVGPKVSKDNEYWRNFLRLIQIILLCTSTYCNRETATILRILLAMFLDKSKNLYPKASFIPKKHFALHLPRQMLMYGPLRHHWCMRFEGKHQFFKTKKIKNFKNLPFSLSTRHQLFMCLKQTGMKGEMSQNFLYDGDIVKSGKEINFSTEYPDLTNQMGVLTQINPLDNCVMYMYKTTSVAIHGLEYQIGCALVLDYEDDIPIFGLLKDIVIYDKDKFFIFQKTEGPAFLNQHILYYELELVDELYLTSFYSLKFKWPLSVYKYEGKLVTMNVNSHTCEIF